MRLIVPFLTIVLTAQSCFAWPEGGHHLIAVLAFNELKPEQQRELIEILKSHPRFAEDFKRPEGIEPDETDRWLIGRAGYWPDIARRTSFDRPTWHYQLGSSLVIGEPKNVPTNPGPLPQGSTLATQGLHIGQAIELCRKIFRDKNQPAAGRAVALCWIIHLVGDSHQPCHAGSLYSEKEFPRRGPWGEFDPYEAIPEYAIHALRMAMFLAEPD